MWVYGPYLLVYLDSVYVRQDKVQQRNTGSVLFKQSDAIAAVEGHDDLVAVAS